MLEIILRLQFINLLNGNKVYFCLFYGMKIMQWIFLGFQNTLKGMLVDELVQG